MKQAIEKLRKYIQKNHVTFEEGTRIRNILKEYAQRNYERKHSAEEYLAFINRHECSFEINHPQAGDNYPYYFTMFSVISQHVQGDCVEECLDQAIAYERQGGKGIVIWYPTEEEVKKEHEKFFADVGKNFEAKIMWGEGTDSGKHNNDTLTNEKTWLEKVDEKIQKRMDEDFTAMMLAGHPSQNIGCTKNKNPECVDPIEQKRLKDLGWMPHSQYVKEKEEMDKKTSEIVLNKTGWLG